MVMPFVVPFSVVGFGQHVPERVELGTCSVLPPPGYAVTVYRGDPLSAVTCRMAAGNATISLKLVRFLPVPGMAQANAKRLESDAAYGERLLPEVARGVGEPKPAITHHSTTFRGRPALEQQMSERGPKGATETYVLKFLVSDNEYWISRSVSAPSLTPAIRSRAERDWSFFKDHLEIAGDQSKRASRSKRRS